LHLGALYADLGAVDDQLSESGQLRPLGQIVFAELADLLVQHRPVKIGGQQGGRWVVTEGLKAGEQVMVDGFQKVAMLPPGTPVQAVPWSPPGAASTPAAAASAPAGK